MAKQVENVVNKILEAEVAEKLQAGPYERSEDRPLWTLSITAQSFKRRNLIQISEYNDRDRFTCLKLNNFLACPNRA